MTAPVRQRQATVQRLPTRLTRRLSRRMPRVQVYLPNDLYDELERRDLPASELLQVAVRAEVQRRQALDATHGYLAELAAEVGEPTAREGARPGLAGCGSGGQIPRMARRPRSMSSTKTSGRRPVCAPRSARSISSRPSGTATESFDNPLAVAGRRTLPAMPARATFEVTGTTCVCQTFTASTSAEDTTTHGLRLSSSIQHTAPRATTVRNAPSAPTLPPTPRRSVVRPLRVRRQQGVAGTAPTPSAWQRDAEADRRPTWRTEHRDCQ